ncbi:tetratricopeptide repeat protein [Thermococcus indicus]|uniref:Tetratricopeptide repeat protein n=1 Tax=Thermococcus indicus TaxID=2586643 RepID=A0A4Y5SMI5_9EURY|nr:ArsR family transcriptional regulator [Thermococcus indicus]QDA32127.1 tetratricopeptide repeat protein [Thermococcus indicus]
MKTGRDINAGSGEGCVNRPDDVALLKSILSETNLQIISLLRTDSLNTREIARLLQKDETQISRGLRNLERMGIVEGRWVRLGGKNVKLYSLKCDEFSVRFTAGGIEVAMGDTVYRRPQRLLASSVPEVKNFVGREEELKLLKGNAPVVAVFGIAGIGKSSLVARAFEDAFWYSMDGSESLEYVAWQMALYLNMKGFPELTEYLRAGGRESESIRELVLEGMEETRSIVVFDDLHKCTDEDVESFLRFLSSRVERGKLILISREKPRVDYERVLFIHLRGLKIEESHRLLSLRIPGITLKESVRMHHLTLGHPLLLVLAAEAPGTAGDEDSLFEYLLGEIYDTLDERERLVLQVLALFDEPVELSALRRMTYRNAFLVLYSLLNKSLVERKGESYQVHDLLRAFIRRVSEVDEERYYREYVSYLLEKNTAREFLTAFTYAARLGDERLIAEITELRVRRLWRVALDFPTAYMRLLRGVGSSPYAKKEMARLYFNRGFFERALNLWSEALGGVEGDFHRFDALMMLVDVHCEMGDIESAERIFSELEGIFRRQGQDPYIRLGYYIELTKIRTFRREREKAIESAFKELEAVRNYPEPYPELEALILYHIGYLYVELGELQRALTYYREGLETANAYSLPFMLNLGYLQMGIVHYYLRNFDEAAGNAKKAAEYFLGVRNYRRALDALFRLTVSLMGLGAYEEAEKWAEKMTEITHSTNYPLGWTAYVLIGILRALRGEGGREYLETGLEKIKNNQYLYRGLIEELAVLFDEEDVDSWLSSGSSSKP